MQFIKFILSLIYYLLAVEIGCSCIGSVASLIIGIIYTIRDAHGFKTVRRPWLFIVLGFAVPVVALLLASTVCPLLLKAAH